MENKIEFNEKLSDWLSSQQTVFEDKNAQENLFRIIRYKDRFSGFTDDEEILMKKIFEGMMELSFIINNNPSQTGKLIQYLQ